VLDGEGKESERGERGQEALDDRAAPEQPEGTSHDHLAHQLNHFPVPAKTSIGWALLGTGAQEPVTQAKRSQLWLVS